MPNGRKNNFSEVWQSGLILILLLLLLFTSSVSVNYIVKYTGNAAELDLLREERRQLLENLEAEIKDGVERRLVVIEGRVYTIEKRVDHLEYRVIIPNKEPTE